MLTANQLHGILPAVPTPVKADDSVDAAAVAALFAWLLKQGIDGVVPLGGTGEYGALSRAERNRMAALSVKAMAGKGPVVAGILDTGFHDALAGRQGIRRRRRGRAARAHAVLYEPDPGRHSRLFPALRRRVAGADPDL